MSQDEFFANSILQKGSQLAVDETAVNNEAYLLGDILKKASIKADIPTFPFDSFSRDLLYNDTSSGAVNATPKNVARDIADPNLNSATIGSSSLSSAAIGIHLKLFFVIAFQTKNSTTK